ncbi:MAG TPA: hypothetical protein VHF08_06550 [Nitrososphaeraceae archaeon]|nr:hypothetical protein [Nitrososphaeraceae archaeon]
MEKDKVLFGITHGFVIHIFSKELSKNENCSSHHGITGSKDYPSPNISVSSPRFIGISRPHARYLSSLLGIEVRCVHNGIPLPPKAKEKKEKLIEIKEL